AAAFRERARRDAVGIGRAVGDAEVVQAIALGRVALAELVVLLTRLLRRDPGVELALAQQRRAARRRIGAAVLRRRALLHHARSCGDRDVEGADDAEPSDATARHRLAR